MRTAPWLNSQIFFRISRTRVLAPLAFFAGVICWTQMLPAQAKAAPKDVDHKAVFRRKHAAKPPVRQPATPAAVVPATPPAPEMPLWPANEKATEATVRWDSQGLYITASNSSLHQILNDVAKATGATVEGLDTDRRIFGVYGPGKARDILSELLQGTNYNVLMVGDQGEGTPREIVLSSRNAAGATAVATKPAPNDDDDADVEDQPQPQVPPPFSPGFGPRGRTPLEVQQELQQRQQDLMRRQEEQQRQQQGQPQPQ